MSVIPETPESYYSNEYPQLPTFPFPALDFDYGWIKNLREVAKKSLQKIYGDYSEFKLKDEDPLDFSDFDAGEFVESSTGPVVYLAVMLVIFLFILIVSLCWCCTNKCCCCCRSNFKGRKDEEQSGGFSVGGITLSIVMAVWLIAFLIMIFHTFPANNKTIDAINEIQPHLDTSIKNLDGYVSGTIKQMLYLFAGSFPKLKSKVEEKVDNFLCPPDPAVCAAIDIIRGQVKDKLDIIQDDLKKESKYLEDALEDIQTQMRDSKTHIDEILDEQIETVTDALYWFFMIFNVLYCIIFGTVLIGTVLSAFSNGSGLKTGGFIVIRCGIVLMFIVGSIVVLQTVVMFVLSGTTSEIICPAIRSLATDATSGESTTTEPSSGDYKVPFFGHVLGECRDNRSAYMAFELQQVYDLNELTTLTKELPVCPATPPELEVECNKLLDEVKFEINTYANFVKTYAEKHLGNCFPVSSVIDSTLDLFCDTMTSPIASYWFIIQFIPPIFIIMFITAMFFERILS